MYAVFDVLLTLKEQTNCEALEAKGPAPDQMTVCQKAAWRIETMNDDPGVISERQKKNGKLGVSAVAVAIKEIYHELKWDGNLAEMHRSRLCHGQRKRADWPFWRRKKFLFVEWRQIS